MVTVQSAQVTHPRRYLTGGVSTERMNASFCPCLYFLLPNGGGSMLSLLGLQRGLHVLPLPL